MTETTNSDPMAFTDEQPTQEPQEAPREETLGDGIIGDTPELDSSEGTGQPEAVTKTSPPEPEETPEERAGRLRQEDYTRKTTEVAEARRALEAERQEFLRQQQEWLQNQQAPRGEAQAGPADKFRTLANEAQRALSDPSIDPAQKASLVAEFQGLNELANLADKMGQFEAFMAQFQEQYEPQFQQTFQTVQQLTERQQSEASARIAGEMAEANQMFGEATVQKSADFIRRNYGVENPATEKPYTIAELTSMATGQPLKVAQEATEANQRARRAAKLSATNNGADTSASGRSIISREEALSNW
jgi:hypothetical protein